MTLAAQTTLDMTEKFPGFISADSRPGYSGWIVASEKLIEFAIYLHDELGYDYLSNLVGVDYLPEEKMEVVYQVYKTWEDVV